MAIENLYDSVIIVYRPTATVDEFAAVVETLAAIGTTRGKIAVPRGDQRDFGAGESASGRMLAFVDIRAALQDRDVMAVTVGPEAPSNWRVLGLARPNNHHIEAVIEPFSGVLG